MWPFSRGYPNVPLAAAGSSTVLDDDATGHGVYDFIVVGGGTAGCALASRLSENPSFKVLLLERGPIADTWDSRVPLMSAAYLEKGRPSERWESLPVSNLGGTTREMAVGKALGGTSRINGLVYTRGAAGEYNRWSEDGRKGWSYNEVEPYFLKSERRLGLTNSKHHGSNGPWPTRPFHKIYLDSTQRCIDAAGQLGIPLIENVNTPDAPSVAVGKIDATIDESAYRCSTYRAFLPPNVANDRAEHLKICTGALATEIRFRDDNGALIAAEVSFKSSSEDKESSDKTFHARATREVILCCGAIANPQLLMLSGVGPTEHLQQHGIETKKHLPGVGSQFKDHVGISIMYRIPLKDSFHAPQKSRLLAITELLKYFIKGEGLFLNPITQVSIFTRASLLDEKMEVTTKDTSQLDSKLSSNIPDLEIMPIAYNTTDNIVETDAKTGGIFSFLAVCLQPKSAGKVRLATNDPKIRPACDLGYLEHPDDWEVLRKGILLAKRIAEKMRESGYPMREFLVPKSESKGDLDEFIRTNYRTTFRLVAWPQSKIPRPLELLTMN